MRNAAPVFFAPPAGQFRKKALQSPNPKGYRFTICETRRLSARRFLRLQTSKYMDEYFKYGAEEIAHLKNADPRMAEAVEKIGRVKRRVIPDLFEALANCIVGQQISTKAHETIWLKMRGAVGRITPEIIAAMPPEEIKKFGISFRKVSYMKSAAQKILDGRFDIEALNEMDDGEVRAKLCELDGVGAWTAEMLMIFSMRRPDVLSYGDYAILRGLRMLYCHREIGKKLFEKYRRRFSPYCSVASLYLWEIAGGAIAGLKDRAPCKKA